ncbi:hypothetical protein TeGR_g12844 [Tetraparma gracilis]|uniref:Uncharacterized protein n=1 Tax=Tetraparma gracilis TaxID=2962635 RepID=A0ABQ6MHC9_9STRA|nr:hypothetical protein TeGR_g12844 [Tetraparma gracilis]
MFRLRSNSSEKAASSSPTSSDSSNPFSFLKHLEDDGYASFFGHRPPVPSINSWSSAQLKTLQMLVVAPFASVLVEEFSVHFPVLSPRPISGKSDNKVSVGDCFWYIDPISGAQSPHMYQIVRMDQSLGQVTAQRILLTLPSIYQSHRKSASAGKPRINLEQNLGEQIQLRTADVATYPQLNEKGFQYFRDNDINIMESGTVSSSSWSPSVEKESSGLSPEQAVDVEPLNLGEGNTGDAALFDADFGSSGAFNSAEGQTFVHPAGQSPVCADRCSASDSDESFTGFCHAASALTFDDNEEPADADAAVNADDARNTSSAGADGSFSELYDPSSKGSDDWESPSKAGAEEGEKKEQAVVKEVVARTKPLGQTVVNDIQYDDKLEKTQFPEGQQAEPDIVCVPSSAPIKTPNDKFSKASTYSTTEISPTSVCITFVQSRATKIQFHDEISDDEVDVMDSVRKGAYGSIAT